MSELAIPLRWTLGGIYGLLVTASAISASWQRLRPSLTITEVSTRIRTWWIMTIAFSVALLAGSGLTIALFALIGLVGTREVLRLAGTTDRTVAGLAFAVVPLSYGALVAGHHEVAWLTPLVSSVFVAPAILALAGRTSGFVTDTAAIRTASLLAVWAPMHAVLLLVDSGLAAPAGPAALLVFLVLCTEVNDVAQFLWGQALGRTPIAPVTSPNKTQAGLVGGLATTAVLATLIGPHLTALTLPLAALAGIVIGVVGFAGDLTVSALKRCAGAKDSGSALPGHGGVLDRIDSLIFTAPAFYALLVVA